MKSRKTLPLIERRDVNGEQPVITDSGTIRGLAIPFDSFTTIGAGPRSFREKVAPGAVTKTLSESDTVYLDNHDPAKPISRTSAGTLKMAVRARGVEYEAEPSDTTYARDLVTNIRAKNILGNSFGFEVVKESWGYGSDGMEERTLLEIKLPEISACTFPAYEDTEIGMRQAYDVAMESRSRFYESRAGDAPGNGKKPYGNVKYADPKNGKYPIDTKAHIKAAWAYINVQKNADEYPLNGVTLSAVKGRIKAAAKAAGITISSDEKGRTMFADLDLRNYNPSEGFVNPTETRDDPDGKEVSAMREALDLLSSGDSDGAVNSLQHCLDHFDDTDEAGEPGEGSDGTKYGEDSNGMVAHTTQGGSAVPVRSAEGAGVVVQTRTLQEVYDLLREERPTVRLNESLRIIEGLLSISEQTPAAEGERTTPKPEASTSEVKRESKEGHELDAKWMALSYKHRA